MTAWRTLLLLRADQKTLDSWKRVLGDHHDQAAPFLRPVTGQRAETYDCPRTGARLAVREDGERYRAYATGAEAGLVEDLELEWDDVQAWGVHEEGLLQALAGCLGVQGELRELDCGAVCLGTCARGACERAVYLCRALDDAGLVRQIGGVRTDAGGPCCVLAAEVVQSAETFSRETGAAYVALSRCVRFERDGLRGECGAPCKTAVRDMRVAELKVHLDDRIDNVGRDFAVLKRENEELKRDLATVLSNLARRVEPEFFQWIFVILGTGSVSAAARELKMSNSTFDDRLKKYVRRGGVYGTLYSMVAVRRKGAGEKTIERFNELFDKHQGLESAGELDVLRALLDGLEDLDESNWQGMRNELIEIVKEVLPEE